MSIYKCSFFNIKNPVLLLSVFLVLNACANNYSNSSSGQISVSGDSYTELDNKGYDYFPKQRPAAKQRVFIFDPYYGAWAAYDENGRRAGVGRASGGSTYCPDLDRSCETVVGSFKIFSKRGANCKSSAYPISTGGGAPMPYCMLFAQGGYAIHGSNQVPDYNASHGCIRVQLAAAQWLDEEFLPLGSTVIVLPYSPNLQLYKW